MARALGRGRGALVTDNEEEVAEHHPRLRGVHAEHDLESGVLGLGDPVVERLEVAKTWRESGEFERARIELRELLATELSLPAASQAQSELQQQVAQAREALRDQVAELAVAGASKILRREVDAKAHADLLDGINKQL